MWRPFSQKHAIESVSIQFIFTENVPTKIYQKALRELDSVAFEQGLTNRQQIQDLEIDVGSGSPQLRASSAGAVMFQNISIDRDFSGTVVQKVVEQLQIGPNGVNFTSFRYNGWDVLVDKTKKILNASLDVMLSAVLIRSLRLQYQDRFIFMGAAAEAKISDLLRESSDLLAPHVFERSDLWHSHTGYLSSVDGLNKRLFQMHADSVDLAGPGDFAGRRSVGIMSAAEQRYAGGGFEAADTSEVYDVLGGLHADAIGLFKRVVTDKMLVTVGLEV